MPYRRLGEPFRGLGRGGFLGSGLGSPWGGGAAAWTPLTPIEGLSPSLWAIAGVQNYQEAVPVTPAVADGDRIGYMYDQSAAGNDLVRHNNDTRRPTLKLNIINGLPVARCDSAQVQNMLFANTVINAGGFYWFLVGKLTDNAANYTFMAEMDGTRRSALYATTTNFEVRYYTGAAYVNGNQRVSVDTNAHVFTLEHTGAAVNLYVDGVQGSGNGTLIPDSAVLKRVGYCSIGALKGDVAEVLCYIGALTVAGRQTVEAYLSSKYI